MKLMNGFSCIRKGTLIQTLKPRSIMLLFSGVYFVSYLTRINYAAVISAIIADEKISASYAAVAVTGAFVTYGAGQLVSGWLSCWMKNISSRQACVFHGAGISAILPCI